MLLQCTQKTCTLFVEPNIKPVSEPVTSAIIWLRPASLETDYAQALWLTKIAVPCRYGRNIRSSSRAMLSRRNLLSCLHCLVQHRMNRNNLHSHSSFPARGPISAAICVLMSLLWWNRHIRSCYSMHTIHTTMHAATFASNIGGNMHTKHVVCGLILCLVVLWWQHVLARM